MRLARLSRTAFWTMLMVWGAMAQPKPATFAVPTEFNAGLSSAGTIYGSRGPYPGLTADLNGDGYDDFITVDQTAGTVVVVLGGSRGFQAPRSFPGVPNPWSIAAGDFNNDGFLDIIVAGTTIDLLLGTGTGSLGPPIIIANSTAKYVATGDFNGDGNLDVALAEKLSNQVVVALGNGDGTFGSFISTSVQTPWALYPGSFHNNGLTDLLLIGDHVSLLTSNGDGTFQQGPDIDSGSWGMAVADMNQDGNEDFVTIYGPGAPVRVWLGDGKGNFTSAGRGSPEGNDAYYVAVADVNGDRIPDVVTANGDFSVSILLGNGDGTLQRNHSYKANAFTDWVGVGRYFYPERADLALLNSAGNALLTPTLSLLRNDGSGRFFPGPQNITVASASGFALADMNLDGYLDLIAGQNINGPAPDVVILAGNGESFGKAIASVPVPALTNGNPAVADFNADGKPDFAVSTNSGISVGLQQANSMYQVVTTPGITGSIAWAGDLNGDGLPDLVLTGGWLVVALGTGQGTFQSPEDVFYPAQYAAVADFNNDGKPDIAVAYASPGGPTILPGNGDGTFGPPVALGAASALYGLVAGDFNNDGNQDVAAVAQGSILVFLGDGKGGFHALAPQPFTGAFPAQMFAADLNGDGNLDVAFDSYGGALLIYLGDGKGKLTQQAITYFAPGNATYTQPGDINNDGKIDLVSGFTVFSTFINTSR